MKLLIADDEKLTRDGLVSSINWEVLGIDEILQAEDGLSAYQIACVQKPDIILSDIRMPRLSGIDFAYKIKDALPDASLIFMSGYSDKDYFKAAIRLKAITYVEKPLDPAEIEDAVQEAVLLRQEKHQTRLNKNLQSLEDGSHLALLLTRPYQDNQNEIDLLCNKLDVFQTSSVITTYIIKSSCMDIALKDAIQEFSEFLSHFHLQSLYVHTHAIYHVFHIIGSATPSSTVLNSIEQHLQEFFLPFAPFYICRGETVQGVTKIYLSYSSAVITMQSSFFYPANTILHTDAKQEHVLADTTPEHFDLFQDFRQALLANDTETVSQHLELLHQKYSCNLKYLPAQVKDIYYRLFAILDECRQQKKISSVSSQPEDSIIQNLENYFCFDDMHKTLCEKIDSYFFALTENAQEDATIYMIKEYIDKHYSEEQLSIKDISEHVFLSASYICTYFKSQTGQTLNQYITEYRMERAMQLLKDSRYQITDISAKVGYSNGNYFGKSFKKFTGVTPSQYREKILG